MKRKNKDGSFHEYRRSAMRNMEDAGVPRSSAIQASGRKPETVYKRYAIWNPKDAQETSRQIEERKTKAVNTPEERKTTRSNNGQTSGQNGPEQQAANP